MNRGRVRQNRAMSHRPQGVPNSGIDDDRSGAGACRDCARVIHRWPRRPLRGRRRLRCAEGFWRVLRAGSLASTSLGREATISKVQPGHGPRPGTGSPAVSLRAAAGQPISRKGSERKAGRVHGCDPVLRSRSASWGNSRALPQLHQSMPRKPAEHDFGEAAAQSNLRSSKLEHRQPSRKRGRSGVGWRGWRSISSQALRDICARVSPKDTRRKSCSQNVRQRVRAVCARERT